MNWQKIALKKLLIDNDYSLYTHLNKELFSKSYRTIFVMIDKYYDAYSKLPTIDVLVAYIKSNFADDVADILVAILESLSKIKDNTTNDEVIKELNKEKVVRELDNVAEDFLSALKNKQIDKVVKIAENIQVKAMEVNNKMPDDIRETDYKMEGLATLPIFLPTLQKQGIHLAGLSVIGSDSGSGKSLFSLQQALYSYKETGVKVGVLSLELPLSQLKARMYSIVNDIPYYEAIKPENKEKILQWQKEYFEPDSFFIKAIRYNVEEIRKAIDYMIKKGVKLIIIDYLNLVEADNYKEEWKQLADLAKDLHAKSVEHNIVILTPTQVNLSENKKGEVEATTRGSRELEFSSSLFLLIHQNKEEYKEKVARIIIKKARNAKKLTLMVRTEFEKMKFVDTSIIVE